MVLRMSALPSGLKDASGTIESLVCPEAGRNLRKTSNLFKKLAADRPGTGGRVPHNFWPSGASIALSESYLLRLRS